jgi:quercetin dioxygenase-like cupin family protein
MPYRPTQEADMPEHLLDAWTIGFLSVMLFLPVVALAQGTGYKLIEGEAYRSMANPTPGRFRLELVTEKDHAKHLNGIFGIIPPAGPGAKVPYHYHRERESVLFIISGAGVEIFDGKEVPFTAGDVMFILPGVKHTIVNRSPAEIRYVEFFTHPPLAADFVEVKDS